MSEGDGATPVGVTATLDAGARTEPTTVTISVAGSGNADAVDFADVEDFTITISAGETSGTGTFTLTPDDDDVDEQDEMLSVEGTSVLPVTADTVELADDDQPSAAIELSARPRRIAEDGGARAVRVRATLDASARTEATTVTVAVAGTGNADAVDFEPVPSFTITIAAGDKRGTGTFTLTPTDDEVDESDEMLLVTGTSVLPVTGTEVELEDDDATSSSIALTAQPPRLSEGDGATPVGVTATLDAGARTEPTTVTISVAGSGNADAVDFADVEDFTITISAGETSGTGTFTLTPDDDDVDEQDEMLSVEGTSVLPVTADTVELADDDQPSAAIELSARPRRIAEDGGARAVRVTATLDASARTEATTVTVAVAGTGNADAVDFEPVPSFTITIAPGDKSGTGTFTLTPTDDEVDESDEMLSVTGTSVLPVTGAEVELEDDDATSSSIALTAQPPRLSEGDGATPVGVTATLDAGARTEPTTVTISVAGSGNADAVDFADVEDFTITISAGETSGTGTFTLTPDDDDVDERDEMLSVEGTSVLPVTADTVELADDDQPSAAIELSARPRRIAEDGGARAVRVTATLDASARTEATTVTVTVADSGQPDAVDYVATATGFDITIAAGATSGTGTFTVTPEDDEVDEQDEVLGISGASDLEVTSTSVTLADDEGTSTEILLSAVPSTVSEGAGATEVEITATLDAGARTVATTVTVSVTGSGDPDAVDFAAVPDFTILIEAGVTSGRETFTLTPEDDNVAESAETLTVDGTTDIPVTETPVTITDNDVASNGIVLSASPALVSEGGGAEPVTVTASLNGAARQVATTVTVSVDGRSGPQAVDFQAVPDFEITIAANAASGSNTFTLTPEDDSTVEVDETLAVLGKSDLPVTATSVTLADDDEASTRILLSAVPERVSEGDGPTPVTVTATLDRALRQTATPVTVSVAGSGDPDAADFLAVPDFALTIPANAASGTGTFTLTPEDDAAVEVDEQVTVRGTSDLPVTPTAVTLVDDDEVSTRILLFLAVDPPRASEGDGEVRVTVTAAVDKGVRPEESRITVSVSGSGDPDAVDFAAVPDFEIVIPANARNGTATFTVVPEDDLIVEADETLTISGVSDLPVAPSTMELLDDDEASTRILLSAVPERVSEGDGPTPVTVTATLDRALRQTATPVTVSVSGSGDPDAADFLAVPDFALTIPANAASGTGTFTLTPEDDAAVEVDEQVTVRGTSDLPVTPTAVTLVDDDEVSTRILLFLAVDPPRASEGDGEVRVTVTAAVDKGVRPEESRITVSVSGSGDPDAVDFAAVPDFEIVIPANARNGTATFTVVPEDDLIVEADETLTISGVSGLPVAPATMELLDDDEASTRILLSAVPERVSEGDGPTPVTVTATLDRALRQTATPVTVSVSGSGDPDAADFLAVPDFALTIPANAASGTGTFTLTPEDDAAVEVDEQVTVRGTSDLPVTPTAVTLVDDDEVSTRILLFLAVDPPRASEGDGEVRVTVTAAVDKGVRPEESRITVSVSGSGDPDAVDFAAVPDFEIVIPANARNGTATFTVVPEDDLIVEADETLTVSGVSDLPVTPATMELLDDDEASTRILLSAVPERVSEGDGPTPVTVTATLDRALRQAATTVTVSVAGSGDPDAVDFDPVVAFGITIPANGARGERHGDVHADAGGRRGGGGGRASDGAGHVRPAGDADGGDARGRRRGVDAHPAVPGGRPAPGVGRRRRGARDGDGGAGQGRAPGRVADHRVGVGQRRSGRGGLRRGAGFRDRDSGERPERDGDVHGGAGRRPDRRGGRDADGIRRLRSARDAGDHGTAGRRRGVRAHPAVGRSCAGIRGRRPGGGDGDRGAGPGSSAGSDDGDRVGVGQRRSGRGGLRRGAGFRDRDSGERPERDGDVHGGAGRRPDRRGGRDADGIRRLRSARDAGDHGTAGRRRGVDADPAVGGSGTGVGRRRSDPGDRDGDPGPRSAASGDDGDRVGGGQRRSRRGGLRPAIPTRWTSTRWWPSGSPFPRTRRAARGRSR